jgi:hypothetical protein
MLTQALSGYPINLNTTAPSGTYTKPWEGVVAYWPIAQDTVKFSGIFDFLRSSRSRYLEYYKEIENARVVTAIHELMHGVIYENSPGGGWSWLGIGKAKVHLLVVEHPDEHGFASGLSGSRNRINGDFERLMLILAGAVGERCLILADDRFSRERRRLDYNTVIGMGGDLPQLFEAIGKITPGLTSDEKTHLSRIVELNSELRGSRGCSFSLFGSGEPSDSEKDKLCSEIWEELHAIRATRIAIDGLEQIFKTVRLDDWKIAIALVSLYVESKDEALTENLKSIRGYYGNMESIIQRTVRSYR